MMLWVVGGACRGVGKTWLSHRMAALLPNAVFAKIGHNPRQPDKPDHYFTSIDDFWAFQRCLPPTCQHCIVESNAPDIREAADVRILIAAPAGPAPVRDDAAALQAEADIPVAPGADRASWERVLTKKLQNPDLVRAVRTLLVRQQQFVASHPPLEMPPTNATTGEPV